MSEQRFTLPEHVAESGVWKEWPKRIDAHLRWGVRGRQIQAFVRNGKLKVYVCPDDTQRLDADALRELFGEPDLIQGRERDLPEPERKRKQAAVAAELAGDPLVLMFNKATEMISALHAQQIAQLRGVSDPLAALLAGYQTALTTANARIATLEQQIDASRALQTELEDLREERAAQLRKEQAAERRRDETLTLLKEQFPSLVQTFLAGDTLSGFARRAPREVVETLVDSGAVSEQDAEIMRRAAGIPSREREQPVTNGVSHGHS